MRGPLRPVRNNRGVAILIAVACIMMISYFAMEITYDSNVEYIVNSQGLNRLKAYYAAKAGVDLSLLRIKTFQKAQATFGKQLGSQAAMLDEIWRFPFAWPLPTTPEMNSIDKDNVKKLVKESMMDANYIVTIEDEGSKIDLNDLSSVSKVLRETTKKRILQIFEQRKKDDDGFARVYGGTDFSQLVDSIQGWMTSTNRTDGGQDKRASFAELNSLAGATDTFPPNRSFRTLAELHFIPGMNDEFYGMLEPLVTIYGMKGLNPNLASKDVLKSLDPGITNEVADEVIKRRSDTQLGGPFKDAQDFWSFVNSKQARLENDTKDIPLVFDTVMNFRIRSTGEFAGASREITAIVMDVSKAASKVSEYLTQEKQDQTASDPNKSPQTTGTAAGNTNSKTATDANNKGPPRIVYWNER